MAETAAQTAAVPDDIADLLSDDTPDTAAPPEPEAQAEPEGAETPVVKGEETPCPDGAPCDDPLSKRQLIELLESEHQIDLSKYANDREALKGLVHAAKLRGVHDLDAQIGKALRGRLGDEEITKIIRGEQQPQPEEPTKGKKDGEPAVDFDESWLYQVHVDPASGDLVPIAGAPKDLPDKIKKYFAHREKVLNEFVKNPSGFVDAVLQGRLQQIEQFVTSKTHEASAAQQREGAVKQWVAENAKVLWVDGIPDKGNTPMGDEFFAKATDLAEAGVTDPIKQLSLALELVQGSAAKKTVPTKVPNPRAQHAGSGSRTTQKFNSAEDMVDVLLDEGVEFDEAFRRARKEFRT